MKIVMTNVTFSNVKHVKALILVATNLVPTATCYVPDTDDAKYARGYEELTSGYYKALHNNRERFVPGANPFGLNSPESSGYNAAVVDFENNRPFLNLFVAERWRLEATGDSPSDVNLLLRFAHTLGKTYRNIDVTIQD